MSRTIRISDYMTVCPETIRAGATLEEAARMMRRFGVRHLPVLEDGETVGILSDRDVKWAAAFGKPKELKVDEVMTPEPFCVRPTTSLEQAIAEMAERKLGAAVVMNEGEVVGIFTTTDALHVLLDIVRDLRKNSSTSDRTDELYRNIRP